MFCNKCGKEGREGELFCWSCGASKGENAFQQPVMQVPVNNQNPVQKKKMPVWLIVLLIIGGTILVGIVGFVVLCFGIVFTVKDQFPDYYEQTSYYVYVGDDAIPTLYNLVGEYDLCNTPNYSSSGGRESYDYYYCDDDMDSAVLDDYIDYLIDYEGFKEFEIKDDYRVVIADSVDEGYVIKVFVHYSRESIEYVKILKEDNTL